MVSACSLVIRWSASPRAVAASVRKLRPLIELLHEDGDRQPEHRRLRGASGSSPPAGGASSRPHLPPGDILQHQQHQAAAREPEAGHEAQQVGAQDVRGAAGDKQEDQGEHSRRSRHSRARVRQTVMTARSASDLGQDAWPVVGCQCLPPCARVMFVSKCHVVQAFVRKVLRGVSYG